ncbi:CWF19-like protein 2 [Impatiens glandulifera]|uniref:CWF19-like protein 2 n=1 Tax=Impatiens glandulifera TaxID=253017 RepID=UPI001FB16F59|nr:CWF19-like protein 2 [Impatiens glandulifera]
MFSGLKFIPKDQIEKEQDGGLDTSRTKRDKSVDKGGKSRKKKSSRHGSSDEDLDKITKRSRRKKWYSSDEYSSSEDISSDEPENNNRNKKTKVKSSQNDSKDGGRDKQRKKSKTRRKSYSSEDNSSFDSEEEDMDSAKEDRKKSKKHTRKGRDKVSERHFLEKEERKDGGSSIDITRKEMGLDWMLRPNDKTEDNISCDKQPEEPLIINEETKENPKELNPYLRNSGTGYPEDSDKANSRGSQLLSSKVIGDGGASWRLKALKRAQEQAAREGSSLDKVVEERWGSLGKLAVSVSSRKAAPLHAHLHASRNRKNASSEEQKGDMDDKRELFSEKDASVPRKEMKMPKSRDSLSWKKPKSHQGTSSKDAGIISSALSSMNKFSNDGSFMDAILHEQRHDRRESTGLSNISGRKVEEEIVSSEVKSPNEAIAIEYQGLSANQLVAKSLQLRMKGKHEEAEKLLKESENMKSKELAGNELNRVKNEGATRRYVAHDTSLRQKKKEEDADIHLASKIMQNKKFSIHGQADDEYDYDDGPRIKSRKKGHDHQKSGEKSNNNVGNRLLTQQERCQFCFENPSRPRHLVVSIANFTYLSLPHWQPVVPGHCCILTMQHESSTRAVDNNVWDELRNFKKCLIMMFAKQEKEVLFLETVMGLSKQRRHCMVDCIPMPQDVAKQGPLYFKKAIDEAEDEWSQHNSKKLIDTSVKGLRGSIPKDFPYFHVEFGLNKGFVHVIDDEQQFKSNFGLNVVRGMLELPEEDIYGRRKQDSTEAQNLAVANFAREWKSFDWTKQLD